MRAYKRSLKGGKQVTQYDVSMQGVEVRTSPTLDSSGKVGMSSCLCVQCRTPESSAVDSLSE